MRKSSLLVLSVCSILILFVLVSFVKKKVEKVQVMTTVQEPQTGKACDNGFAVVELFTSEGCSSCPPAESLMKGLSDTYKGRSVYFVEYHVDYWNKLGWKDQFSKADFTAHQYFYGSLFHLNSVYTPQAVINGSFECVGSNESKITAAINDQLSSLSAEKQVLHITANAHQIMASIEKESLQKDEVAVMVVVGDQATVSISRGENSGLKLVHHNIALERIETAQSGSFSTEYNIDNFTGNIAVLSFVQNKQTGKVRSANIVPISKK